MTLVTPTRACVPCRARKTKCDAAVRGFPCSGCVSRNCAESCAVATRKRRRRPGEAEEGRAAAAPPTQHRQSQTVPAWNHGPASSPRQAPASNSVDKRQSQTQLHYFHILQEAVDDGALNDENDKTGTPFDSDASEEPWQQTSQLDDADREYLKKKKVFDLPSKSCLLAFITSYFMLVEPYSPIIAKAEFVAKFENGNLSLFLLYAILATSSLYVPAEGIQACGFKDRTEAQSTFATRATLVYDFQLENDSISLLQGSLLMTRVLLEHPTDKDSNYWFFNALRLATKLELYSRTSDNPTTRVRPGIHSRIAWALYCRHMFYLVSEFRSAAYLNCLPAMEAPTRLDWESEHIPKEYCDIVPVTTTRQQAVFIAICKMAKIYGEILSSVARDPCVDLEPLLHPLGSWRTSLATQLDLGDQSPNSNLHYLDLIASSYRYEATISRSIQRRLRAVDARKRDSAKQRLRSAMRELDAITGRILANDMMKQTPISLMTAMPALLALHLEVALDPAESELARSMSRISISQTMLALEQLREIPAIKKAKSLFELILSRKNLYSGPATSERQMPAPCESQCNQNVTTEPHEINYDAQDKSLDSFLQEFLDYDSLAKWDFGQVDFTRLA